MGGLAKKLFELFEELPPAEQEEVARLILARRPLVDAGEARGDMIEKLPRFSGGAWLAGDLGRDEIYQDESDHALPR